MQFFSILVTSTRHLVSASNSLHISVSKRCGAVMTVGCGRQRDFEEMEMNVKGPRCAVFKDIDGVDV
jgi:hypothetical protein